MQADDGVTEERLRRMLSQRSGVPEDELFTPVMLARHDKGLRWPVPPEAAEEIIAELLDRMRSALPAPTASLTTGRAGRYVFLSEFTPRYEVCSTRRIVDRVRFAGTAPVRRSIGDTYDPRSDAGWGARPSSAAAPGEPRPEWGWWKAVRAAGPRPAYRMPDPWAGQGPPPVDRALDEREATGSLQAYRRRLREALDFDPRLVDCWAHLGSDALQRADDGDPSGLREALGFYQGGVTIAELALTEVFTGVLAWGDLDNRPFHRALHGLGLTLWRLGEWAAAEAVFGNSLWLNPADNQGIRFVIGPVRHKTRWGLTSAGLL